jgi:hypothetical protein
MTTGVSRTHWGPALLCCAVVLALTALGGAGAGPGEAAEQADGCTPPDGGARARPGRDAQPARVHADADAHADGNADTVQCGGHADGGGGSDGGREDGDGVRNVVCAAGHADGRGRGDVWGADRDGVRDVVRGAGDADGGGRRGERIGAAFDHDRAPISTVAPPGAARPAGNGSPLLRIVARTGPRAAWAAGSESPRPVTCGSSWTVPISIRARPTRSDRVVIAQRIARWLRDPHRVASRTR